MKIGFDAKRAFQNNTGLGNYSRMLVTGLAERHQEDQIVLYAPDMSGEYRTFFSSYANISSRKPSGFDRNFPNLWRSFGVSMHLNSDNVDIFHGLSHELPHRIPSRVKTVVTMHDLIVWRYPEFYTLFDRMMHRAKQHHACRTADIVVAISKQTKQDLIHFMHVPEEKIRVIYQSCDSIFWNPVTEMDREYVRSTYHLPARYFVCVGTIEERKNQLAVVQAMNELPEDVHIVVVGRSRGSYNQQVHNYIEEFRLGRRVHLLNNAIFEDFPALYAESIGSVYMSKFEGFGIPILEAMCCDTPVVTSNVSSMPEVTGDAALYANPANPHEIAQQMLRIVKEPDLRSEMIAKGRCQRERFSRERSVQDMYALYQSLVGEEEE